MFFANKYIDSGRKSMLRFHPSPPLFTGQQTKLSRMLKCVMLWFGKER